MASDYGKDGNLEQHHHFGPQQAFLHMEGRIQRPNYTCTQVGVCESRFERFQMSLEFEYLHFGEMRLLKLDSHSAVPEAESDDQQET